MRILSVLAMVAVAGCSAGKAPIDDEFTAEGKADTWDTSSKLIGDFDRHEVPANIPYTKTPRYRSIVFHATGGQFVDLWVRSADGSGDAVAYLLDFQHKVIAKNDDADATTSDAHIHVASLPPSNGNYMVFFRDYYGNRAKFQFSLTKGIPNSAVGDAEKAYDSAIDTLDQHVIDKAKLPSAARARFDHETTLWQGVTAYKLTAGSKTIYGVAAAAEEIYWIDLYDSAGKLIIHGFGGDGGPDITGWGPPASYDPSNQ